jgi:hypothetical protein
MEAPLCSEIVVEPFRIHQEKTFCGHLRTISIFVYVFVLDRIVTKIYHLSSGPRLGSKVGSSIPSSSIN